MPPFEYLNSELCADTVPLSRLADEYGTPLYVYSANAIRDNYRRLAAAFAPLRPLICYAVKANFNLALMRILKDEGAGFDIVSGGELHRALLIGADPTHIVFAGVGKTDAEMREGLKAGVGWFNVESADELARLNALAAGRGARATVALRLNPGVTPDTHHHISTGGGGSKFGLPVDEALALVRRAANYPALIIRGVHIHIGSQVPAPRFTLQAIEVALNFIERASSVTRAAATQSDAAVDCLNFGGGFPVPYRDADRYPSIEEFAAPMVERLSPIADRLSPIADRLSLIADRLSFHLEPGRYLVANAGALVTTVQAVKEVAGRRTLVVDAGMNTILRPALYDAYHRVLPLHLSSFIFHPSDIVGPICESTDVLARDRALPPLKPRDRLAVMDVGAYGFSMASQYNSQPRPAEGLVDGEVVRLIRRRETYRDLVGLESW
jgi:diaminopimelate decarboxylase